MKRRVIALGSLALAVPAHGRPEAGPPLLLREIAAPGGGTMLLTIVYPKLRGPRPAILIMHGTHGFADEYVVLAREIAEAGFVGIAACWFAPGQGKGVGSITPRACPASTPSLTDGDTPEGLTRAAALVKAVSDLPGVDRDRVILMGHSRGAVAAMYHGINHGEACGIVLNSGAYPPEATRLAGRIRVPVLVLHGEADDASQGGSPMTQAFRAHDFVRSLLQAGAKVQARFYEKGNHNSLFLDEHQHQAEMAEIVRFARGIPGCKAIK